MPRRVSAGQGVWHEVCCDGVGSDLFLGDATSPCVSETLNRAIRASSGGKGGNNGKQSSFQPDATFKAPLKMLSCKGVPVHVMPT